MKTRFMKIVMIVFALIIAFSFAACEKSNDYQALLDKITELEQKLDDKQTASDKALADLNKQLQDADSANFVLIEALQVKVTALEAANTQYKAQVEALAADIQALVKPTQPTKRR